MIPSLGIRISSEFENMNEDLDNIAEFEIPDVPPWTFSRPRVLFSLHVDKKSQTDSLVSQTKFHGLLSDFPGGGRVVRWCWVNFQCRGVLPFGLQ